MAERWFQAGMKALRVTEDALKAMPKNCATKYALAWLARRHTAVRTAWIKDRLHMGTATCFSAHLKKLETARRGGWGHAAYSIIENIKL